MAAHTVTTKAQRQQATGRSARAHIHAPAVPVMAAKVDTRRTVAPLMLTVGRLKALPGSFNEIVCFIAYEVLAL